MTPFELAAASAEVAGRHALLRFPDLRRHIGRWARRAPAQAAAPAPISAAAFEAALRSLGELSGRDLLVHSAWDSLRRVSLKPSGIVELLRALIGPQATLLMPTHPVTTAPDVVAAYDVDKTPSSVGLLTESMRRMPGARRSPFPIAPVCALGPRAEAYAADFRSTSGSTAYGRGSPYAQLVDHGGQALFLGIAVSRANTLQHAAFDLLEGENPIPDYYVERTFRVTRGGSTESWTVRSQKPSLERFLATAAFDRMMNRAGLVRSANLDGISLSLVDAAAFVRWHVERARQSGMPYWGWNLAR